MCNMIIVIWLLATVVALVCQSGCGSVLRQASMLATLECDVCDHTLTLVLIKLKP